MFRAFARGSTVQGDAKVDFERRHRAQRHELFGRVKIETPFAFALICDDESEMYGILRRRRATAAHPSAPTRQPATRRLARRNSHVPTAIGKMLPWHAHRSWRFPEAHSPQ